MPWREYSARPRPRSIADTILTSAVTASGLSATNRYATTLSGLVSTAFRSPASRERNWAGEDEEGISSTVEVVLAKAASAPRDPKQDGGAEGAYGQSQAQRDLLRDGARVFSTLRVAYRQSFAVPAPNRSEMP